MEKHASWLSYTASGGAVVCGMTLNDWGMLAGIIIGIITCGVNWYFKIKDDRRKERELQHELKD